jgi:HEAT repeat protein
MTALLLPLVLAAPVPSPAVAPAPRAVPAAEQITAWAADLSSPDPDRRRAAATALIDAGPRAAPAVPAATAVIRRYGYRADEVVDVLWAVGPAAKPAVPSLLALLPAEVSGGGAERVALAVARIDGPKPEATLALLLTRRRCNPIVLEGSHYLHDHPAAVVPHVVALCGHTDAVVRERAATVLGNLGHITRRSEPGAPTLLRLAGDGAAGVPAALERLLADEALAVRMTAAGAVGRVAPELVPKAFPVVVAALADPAVLNHVGVYGLVDILRRDPGRAAALLVPLLGAADDGVRSTAVHTLAELPVRVEVEAALTGGKTARARAAAADCLGRMAADGPAAGPALTKALADPDFPVRFAAARSLTRLDRGGSAVPVLVEGLGHADARQDAVNELSRLGREAKAAAPELKKLLADRDQEFALEAALALARIAPADAADAVPVLARRVVENGNRASAAAVALGTLGPAAKAALPDLVKAFAAEKPNVRITAAEAAVRIDPARAGPATEALVGLLKDKKLSKGGVRAHAAEALARIGPGAKAAVPVLVDLLNDDGPFHAEIAVAAVRVDPSAENPAVAWIRTCLADARHDDRYEVAEQVRDLGPAGAALVPDFVSLLGSDDPHFRWRAVEALGAVGPGAAAALPQLRAVAAGDPREPVRKAAAAAVKAVEGK